MKLKTKEIKTLKQCQDYILGNIFAVVINFEEWKKAPDLTFLCTDYEYWYAEDVIEEVNKESGYLYHFINGFYPD